MLEIGLVKEATFTVTSEDTAKAIGSGGLEVLATPKILEIVENLAFNLVECEMEEGNSTVGSFISINHIAPTVIGHKFAVKVVLKEIDRRKLSFSYIANDEKQEIANGEHIRFIIDTERFMNKANS